MAIIKCSKGHFYDDEKYTKCPMCQNAENIDEKTVALYSVKNSDDEKTIGINLKKNNHDPVVGWLVCINGPDKGRDYRIHAGRNFIGRDFSNDICLTGDKSISRKNAGCIVYEPRKNIFIAMNESSIGIYINGNQIMKPQIINECDIISIGIYEFELIAYCKGDKKW